MKKARNKVIQLISSSMFLIIIGMGFGSCEATKDFSEATSKLNKKNSSITFDQFKNETNQNDFKTKINIKSSTNLTSAKNADGSYELSDFDIDTDIIKRLELNNKTTYSFRIYPTVIVSPKSIYNLVLQNINGQWVESVVEFKTTDQNYEEVISGINEKFQGKASLLYTSNESEIITSGACHRLEIISTHCNGLGNCTNEICDACLGPEGCVEKQYATFCLKNNSLTLDNETDIMNKTETIVSNTNPKDYSLIANINDLKKQSLEFAKSHVAISNKILMLLDSENNLNFDDFPYTQLDSSQNQEQFIQALANTGMIKYEEMYNLLLLQNQNASKFITKNKDFTSLKPATRNLIITDAINAAIIDNPITFVPPTEPVDNSSRLSCGQQYVQDRQDCAEDALVNWGILATGCWFATPAACAVGGAGVLAIACICSSRAKRDYAECVR